MSMTAINVTHDPMLSSWVSSANAPASDFPIQNLPFCAFRRARSAEHFRGGVAIGDQVLDLGALHGLGLFDGLAAQALAACAQPALNAFMGLGAQASAALRAALSSALRTDSALAEPLRSRLVPQNAAEYRVAAQVGDFTDFYASIHHATAVGRLLRPDNPLLPNYKWLPIAYHGRASSIVVSGHQFPRPVGQILPSGATAPILGPSKRMDYELELGVFIGSGNALGSRIDIADAESHIFGLCLLNDWSARDLQTWEYQPLGPFLAKNFATTISPWIVTLQALEPYRTGWERPLTDPQPVSYLDSPLVRSRGAIDIQLEVYLESQSMRPARQAPSRLSASSFKHAYWTPAQMVAHHTVNGCNLQPGDLLGTGTQSGPLPGEAGSLLELSRGGTEPVHLANGETRRFLEDEDAVILRGYAEQPGFARIGFGAAIGRVLAVADV